MQLSVEMEGDHTFEIKYYIIDIFNGNMRKNRKTVILEFLVVSNFWYYIFSFFEYFSDILIFVFVCNTYNYLHRYLLFTFFLLVYYINIGAVTNVSTYFLVSAQILNYDTKL